MTETHEPTLRPMPLLRPAPLDPSPEYAQWRAQDPSVVRVRSAEGHDVWLPTRYEHMRVVLGDRRFSSDERRAGYPSPQPGTTLAIPGNFMLMDPPKHDELRKMLSREFLPARIEALRPAVQRIADELIDEMCALTPPVDLVAHFALRLPSLAICSLLGVPVENCEFFQARADVVASSWATPEQVTGAYAELAGFLARLLDAKGDQPDDDLLSRLAVDRLHTGQVSIEEAVGMTLLLLVGGHETTSSMIGMATVALLAHPDQRDALLAEPTLAANAADELLRYLSTVQFGLRRVATEDVLLGGSTIRAGDGVVVPLQAANRDPAVFPDPDRLDVTRPEARRHFAFGYGIHQCIGLGLARMEIEIAMRTLFQRLPDLRLAIPFAEVSFRPEALDYCVADLPIAW